MEEKILIKGVFSKFNIISIFFCAASLLFTYSCIVNFVDGYHIGGIILLGVVIVALTLAYVFYLLFNRAELTVTDKRVYGKIAFGKRVDLPFDKISSVGTSIFHGISVATSSGRIVFYCCQNKDKVFGVISDILLKRQGNNTSSEAIIKQEIPQSNADELKKFKDLLDSGVITQEEFDAKKKQLLGL